MKKYLLSITLSLLIGSSLAIADTKQDEQYNKLKPVAYDIFKRSVALAEGADDSYQSLKYTDDKAVWSKARDERRALLVDEKKLGNSLSSPFRYCMHLASYSGMLWGQSVSEGKIDVSTFKSYITAKKDCEDQLNNPPEDKSNLRAVDL